MSKQQYREWRALIKESSNWTPSNNKIEELRKLFSELTAPSVSRLGELRLVEHQLNLTPSSWDLNGSYLRPKDRRHLDFLTD